MDENVRILIALRVERCREDMAVARTLLAQGFWRVAVNRAYYAVFHMATASLLTLGIARTKHTGVQAAFGQYIIKAGLIEPEYHRIYLRALTLREEADYADEIRTLNAERVSTLVTDAERFVGRLERYLHDVGAIS